MNPPDWISPNERNLYGKKNQADVSGERDRQKKETITIRSPASYTANSTPLFSRDASLV